MLNEGYRSKFSTNDNFLRLLCRYATDEVGGLAASTYGDSETETEDEDDEDDLLLDSVSVRGQGQGQTHLPPLQLLHHYNKDTDSGRGESPESLHNGHAHSKVVIRHKVGGIGNRRPISAVPSEFSDISTTSRSSEEGVTHVPSEATPTLAPEEAGLEEGDEEDGEEDEQEDYGSRMDSVYKIAGELLSTEEQYVKVLHLIDQVSSVSTPSLVSRFIRRKKP